MAETQTYSRIEIERYLQHKMSQQEMHEFEKALMNDPFLADALEGFAASDASLVEAHLAEIESAVTGNQQKAKVVPLPHQKTAWWKVAAIVLVMVSAGAITWSVVNYSNSTNKNSVPIAASASKSINLEKDSLRPVDKPVARLDIPRQNHFPLYKQNTSPIIRPDAITPVDDEKKDDAVITQLAQKAEETKPLLAASAPSVITANPDSVFGKQMKFSRSLSRNEFKGKVVDKSGEPLAFVDIKANNGSISTVSDANGNFTLKAADSTIDVNLNSPGYVAAKATIKTNKADTKITMKENDLSLSEVVVTAMANKKKSASPTIHVDSTDAAAPVGGWKNFQQYLSKQQDFIRGIESFQNLSENIVLEFLIDKRGQPTDIRVPEEMDKTMAEKTIEIISNGPRWKNKKKDKKVKVIIGF